MRVQDVNDLTPQERFLYWIKERHAIYLRRLAGKPKPWTDDQVLQNFFFTNPYRENDKTTVWFRENAREKVPATKIILATTIFRWFNYIPTGEELIKRDLLLQWNQSLALTVLSHVRGRGGKVFTGAFMINSPGGEKKLEAICRRINNVWIDRERLLARSLNWTSLRKAHVALSEYEGLGGFMAYEIVCDLRYTEILERANDKLTWCNPGPGCIRGLYRIAGEEIKNKSNAASPPKPKNWLDRMAKLLAITRTKLRGLPPMEMREIEHSLCEFDKYERARIGDGKLKRKYRGG